MGEKHHKTEGRHKSDRDHAYFDRLDIQRHKRTDAYIDPQSLRPPEADTTAERPSPKPTPPANRPK